VQAAAQLGKEAFGEGHGHGVRSVDSAGSEPKWPAPIMATSVPSGRECAEFVAGEGRGDEGAGSAVARFPVAHVGERRFGSPSPDGETAVGKPADGDAPVLLSRVSCRGEERE
jgi:hypothetical protein